MSVLQRLEKGVFVVEVFVGGFITHEFKFPDLGEITPEQMQKVFANATVSTMYTPTEAIVQKCQWVDAPSVPQKHVPVPAVQPKPAQNGPRLKASVPTPAVIPLPTQNFPMMEVYTVHEILPPVCQFATSANDPASGSNEKCW